MLQHVTLEVGAGQMRACVAFWELLGFEELVPPPSLRDRFTWLGRAGTQIHLVAIASPAVPERGHTAIVAGEPAAILEALRRAGFDPQPGSNAWDAPRWFVHDPAGHRVELMSAPPPSVRRAGSPEERGPGT